MAFERLSSGDVVSDGGQSRGVAWGDLDGDGWYDLAVSNAGNENEFLYVNDRQGGFRTWREGWPVFSAGWSEGVAWVDYDGDGDSDLFVANSRGMEHPTGAPQPGSQLYRNEGAGELTPVNAGGLTQPLMASQMGCWGDADGDGDLDVFVVNRDFEPDVLLVNDRASSEFRRANGPWDARKDDGRSCGWGDADNDGDLDLYVANALEPQGNSERLARNALYRNEGGGSFVAVTNGPAVEDRGFSYGVSWVDYDDDGDLDLFVTNIARRDHNALYENDGHGRFARRDDLPVMTDGGSPSKGHTWGDFDLDGDLDLFIANGTEGTTAGDSFDIRDFLYLNRGDGVLVRTEVPPLTTDRHVSAGAAAADYDRDGDLDLFVANWGGNDEDNDLYRSDASARGNHWLALRLRGRAPNTDAIGARVGVLASLGGRSRWQYRTRSSSTGYASQDAPELLFGLAGTCLVKAIEVRWPDGAIERFEGLAANARWLLQQGEQPQRMP